MLRHLDWDLLCGLKGLGLPDGFDCRRLPRDMRAVLGKTNLFRPIFGDSRITPTPMAVATAQAVEQYDMVGLVADTIVRASDTSWASAIATPSAPGVAASAATRGTALTNALTAVKVAIQFPWGEGALSAAGTATPTAAFGLAVTLAACPAPGLGWNVYVETSAGSGVFKLQQFVPYNVAQTIVFVDSYGNGHAPAADNQGAAAVLSDATTITQYNFAQTFAGVSNQRKLANVAQIFGNNGANLIMVNRGGGGVVFEADCASTSWQWGQFVAPAKDTGNALLNQTVVAPTGPTLWKPGALPNPLAIGTVVQDTTNSTKVWIQILEGPF